MSQKLALLFGNLQFEASLPPLHRPGGDVGALARVLRDPAVGGFDEATPVLDAPSPRMRREIARFLAKRGQDDLLLLYYSGHGLLDERGALYLAAHDTERGFLSATAIPAAFVTGEMDQCPSRRQILILDCCYSGAFERGAKGSTDIPAATFEGNGVGRIVLTASSSTELAWEETGADDTADTSVFTRHLIEGLETGAADLDDDGHVGVDELYKYVYRRVVEENPRQNPRKWTYRQEGGDLILARHVGWARKPAELPAYLREALESPLARVREGAISELATFVRGNDSRLAESARQAARKALDDDSRRVALAAAEVLAAAGTAQTGLQPVLVPVPSLPPDAAAHLAAQPGSRLEEGQRASPLSLALAGPQRDAVGPASEDDHGHPLPQPPPVELPTAPRKGTRAALSAGLRILLLLVFFVGVVAMVMVENAIDAREKERQAAAEARKEASLAAATRVHLAEIEAKGKTLLAVAKTWPLRPENERDLSTNGHSNETSRLVNYAMQLTLVSSSQFAATVVYNYLPPTVTDFYLKTDVKGITGASFYGLVFRVDQDHKRYYELVVNNQYYWLYIATDFAKRYLFPSTFTAALKPIDQGNTLAILARGPEIVVFINDRAVGEVSDVSYASGAAGVLVYAAGAAPTTLQFSHLELRLAPTGAGASGTIPPPAH